LLASPRIFDHLQNTSWTVRVNRVWSEWTEEGNDLIQIIGDSETILQVNPEILNITDKDELNCWYRETNFHPINRQTLNKEHLPSRNAFNSMPNFAVLDGESGHESSAKQQQAQVARAH